MLTTAQLDARKGKLTASRVGALMSGDPAKIMRLWLEMTDQQPEENLDHVWPVQLGSCTEQLNLDWYERKHGQLVTRRGEVVVHPRYDWLACTLDGFVEDLACPLETKHVGGREPLEVIIERYQPQMHVQMMCTGATQCALSVIMGANEPLIEFVPRDRDYTTELLVRAQQFMEHVRRLTLPVVLPPALAPMDASKVYDFETNNLWCDAAFDWLGNKHAADIVKDAEKMLKSIVPADAKKCSGAGVRITRDRAGRLSLREDA